MSTEIAWLEQFTGLPLAEGKPDPKRAKALEDGRAAAEAQDALYERKRQQQALLLAQVRADLEPIKARSQKLLSTKIQAGPLKGKSFLKVEGEQIDEIDPDTLRMLAGGKKQLTINDLLSGDIGPQIALVVRDFDALGARLAKELFEDGGKSGPLFTAAEVQAEYWAPLRLERIYPDGLVLDKYSETQQMLDATNQLYLEMCEQKKIAGQLTPESDLVSELLGAGKDLAGMATDVLGAFAPGSDQIKLAADILDTMGGVFESADEIYKQAKESDYAGAASGAIDIAGKLTALVVGRFAGESVGKTVAASFAVGSAAVVMGKSLAQYRNGDGTLADALNVVGDLVAKSLTLAASQTSGAAADGLQTAAKVAPSALRVAGLASGDLAKAVREGDFPGVVKTLGAITKEVLSDLPGLQVPLDTLDTAIDLGAAGAAMAYKMAVNARKGELLAAFNTAIADVSDNLGKVLGFAGVPDDLAKTVIGAYQGAVSASKAVQMLAKDPGDVMGAIGVLSGGLDKALAGSGDPLLKQIGDSIKLGIDKMVAAKEIKELYEKGDSEGALKKLVSEVGCGIKTAIDIAAPSGDDGGDGGDDGDDSGSSEDDGSGGTPQPRKPKGNEAPAVTKSLAAMIEALQSGKQQADPEKVKKAAAALEEERKRQDAEDANEQARALLAQTELDLKALSDAERTGAEASNIDNLIADLLRDRMILKIATQIAQGGAEFLSQFVPALGAVSAGVKLAANLVTVAQRAAARRVDQGPGRPAGGAERALVVGRQLRQEPGPATGPLLGAGLLRRGPARRQDHRAGRPGGAGGHHHRGRGRRERQGRGDAAGTQGQGRHREGLEGHAQGAAQSQEPPARPRGAQAQSLAGQVLDRLGRGGAQGPARARRDARLRPDRGIAQERQHRCQQGRAVPGDLLRRRQVALPRFERPCARMDPGRCGGHAQVVEPAAPGRRQDAQAAGRERQPARRPAGPADERRGGGRAHVRCGRAREGALPRPAHGDGDGDQVHGCRRCGARAARDRRHRHGHRRAPCRRRAAVRPVHRDRGGLRRLHRDAGRAAQKAGRGRQRQGVPGRAQAAQGLCRERRQGGAGRGQGSRDFQARAAGFGGGDAPQGRGQGTEPEDTRKDA